MEPQEQTRSTRKSFVLTVAVVILLLVVWKLSGYSVITIQTPSTASGKTEYRLLNQKSKKLIVATSSNGKITKVVPKASYQIMVTQGNSSSFNIARTRGFFRKTSVSAKLSPLPARQFVGNGPEACLYYLNNVLYSYNCTGATTKTTHAPATAGSPTYNSKSVENVFGSFEGVVTTKQGTVALFVNNTPNHSAFVLESSTKLGDGVVLTGLDPKQSYSLATYKDGFIVYNSSFTEIKYYASTTSSPEDIQITKPQETVQRPLLLRTSGSTIVVSYSDKADFETRTDPENIGEVRSEVMVYADGQITKLSLNKQYVDIRPCGSNKLCLLDIDGQMSVQDTEDKAKPLYVVEGVNSMVEGPRGLSLVREKDILNFDVNRQDGYLIHRSSGDKYCGFLTSGDNYLLCVTNRRGQNSVLLITSGVADTNNIDSKVSKLLQLSEVSSVSPYGNYIFMTANVGDQVYNSSLNEYVYDPAKQKKATDKINQTIQSFGPGPTVYKIINGAP